MLNMTVVGRLGRDVELRYVPGSQGETAVANIALACDYQGRDGKCTQWVEGSMWGKRAEALAEHLTKGKQLILVLSDAHIETYQGQNGEGHKLVGRVENLEFGASPRGDGEDHDRGSNSGGGQRRDHGRGGQGRGGQQRGNDRGQQSGRDDRGGGEQRNSYAEGRGRSNPPAQAPKATGGSGFDDLDDDIPF